MNIKLLFLLLQVPFIVTSCQNNSSTTEPTKDISKIYEAVDTLNIKGVVRLKEKNDWQIYADNSEVPLCPIKIEPDSSWEWNAIPDSLKIDGIRIKALAVVVEPPHNLRLSCALVQILKIEKFVNL